MVKYIHNTTFIIDCRLQSRFVDWARTVYIPAARDSGRFGKITMARVLTQVDPATLNYAIQLSSDSLESARQWHQDVATLLRDDIASRLGRDRILFFSTDMEIIEADGNVD